MGLDMMAYSIPPDKATIHSPIDVEWEEKANEIAYWRKHNALHAWFEKKYNELGGTDVFNCVAIQLTPEILENLRKDIHDRKLIPTSGFFFGTTDYDPYEAYSSEDLAFINRALTEINDGNVVVYTSWW